MSLYEINHSFRILNSENHDDKQVWLSAWESWPGREVFAHPDYVDLFTDKNSCACCGISATPTGTVLYPFILRDISGEPYYVQALGSAFDIVTPYGYGGPFCFKCPDKSKLAKQFWEVFESWTSRQNIVSEFIRFSLLGDTVLDYPGEKEFKFDNIVRDLLPDKETIWMDYEHKVRKNVKKAIRNGIHVETDENGYRLDDFLRIYNTTMDRRNADKGYYFGKSFFETISSQLFGQHIYFHACSGKKVVSTELVLVSSENVYSYLGGTDGDYFDSRPNDLLKHEIILWAKSHGKKRFVLGGGYQKDDGIYKYKSSFAPRGVVPFWVGYRVLNSEVCRKLVNARTDYEKGKGTDWTPRAGYFPPYR